MSAAGGDLPCDDSLGLDGAVGLAGLAGLVITAIASMACAHGGGTGRSHACVDTNSGEIKVVGPSNERKGNARH